MHAGLCKCVCVCVCAVQEEAHIDSPVMAAWSTYDRPLSTVPSMGIRSPDTRHSIPHKHFSFYQQTKPCDTRLDENDISRPNAIDFHLLHPHGTVWVGVPHLHQWSQRSPWNGSIPFTRQANTTRNTDVHESVVSWSEKKKKKRSTCAVRGSKSIRLLIARLPETTKRLHLCLNISYANQWSSDRIFCCYHTERERDTTQHGQVLQNLSNEDDKSYDRCREISSLSAEMTLLLS